MTRHAHHLDITDGRVNSHGKTCGTVHCIGGWYAIATHPQEIEQDIQIDFYTGKDTMLKDLGFERDQDINYWASNYPQIWGNHYGADLFVDIRAWDNAKSIPEVIQFLEGVRDRSPD